MKVKLIDEKLCEYFTLFPGLKGWVLLNFPPKTVSFKNVLRNFILLPFFPFYVLYKDFGLLKSFRRNHFWQIWSYFSYLMLKTKKIRFKDSRKSLSRLSRQSRFDRRNFLYVMSSWLRDSCFGSLGIIPFFFFFFFFF